MDDGRNHRIENGYRYSAVLSVIFIFVINGSIVRTVMDFFSSLFGGRKQVRL
jgi:hypothetical protein